MQGLNTPLFLFAKFREIYERCVTFQTYVGKQCPREKRRGRSFYSEAFSTSRKFGERFISSRFSEKWSNAYSSTEK